MKLAGFSMGLLCLAACAPATAATLRPAYVDQAASGHQKAWHATLDLRDLPADKRPGSVGVIVDAHLGEAVREVPLISVTVNGVVVGRAWARRDGPTKIDARIEDRLFSTRNHVAVAVTSLAQQCPAQACDVTGAELRGSIRFGLAEATAGPITFAQWVTRFRKGVAVKVVEPRDRALGERVVQAIAPHAPRRAAGPAEIVVSREPPKGVTLPLRLDTGPVTVRDRDGRLLYDRARLEGHTLVQIGRRGDRPVLWVRPGTQPLAAMPLELDYGNVALFGARGREIAWSPDQDKTIRIAYAADARREARTGLYWRLAIAALWLAVTAGLVLVLRRMAPLERPRLEPGQA